MYAQALLPSLHLVKSRASGFQAQLFICKIKKILTSESLEMGLFVITLCISQKEH